MNAFDNLQIGDKFKFVDYFGIKELSGIYIKHSKTLFLDGNIKRKYYNYMGEVIYTEKIDS